MDEFSRFYRKMCADLDWEEEKQKTIKKRERVKRLRHAILNMPREKLRVLLESEDVSHIDFLMNNREGFRELIQRKEQKKRRREQRERREVEQLKQLAKDLSLGNLDLG